MQSAISSLLTSITHGATMKTGLHTSVLVAKLNLQAVDHVAAHVVTHVDHAVTHVATHVATHALPHVVTHVVQPVETAHAVYQTNGVFGLKAACRLINDLSIL